MVECCGFVDCFWRCDVASGGELLLEGCVGAESIFLGDALVDLDDEAGEGFRREEELLVVWNLAEVAIRSLAFCRHMEQG